MTEKNLSINPKNQSKAAFILSNEFGKTEPMKTFDSSNQSEKYPALVFFKFKIHPFSAIHEVNGRIVDYSLFYWIFLIHYLKVSPLNIFLFLTEKKNEIFFF